MSVLYIRDKTTGKFVQIKTIKGEKGDTGAVDGLNYHETAPSALGEASPGVSDLVARGDHVHPLPTPEDIGAATQEDADAAMAKAQEAVDAVNARLNVKMAQYIPVSSWTGADAPYVCELNADGVYDTDTPIMDMVASSDPATAEKEEESYAKIYKVATGENKITLYAREKPTCALTIQFLNI